MRASVKVMVIYRYKDKYSISEMCRFFDVSRSVYYDYVKRMDAPEKDLPLVGKIKECQEKHGKTYDYRRVYIWLERQGIHHNPKTILRVMQKYNLLSEVRRKNTTTTVMYYINTTIFLTEILTLIDRIKNGLHIYLK